MTDNTKKNLNIHFILGNDGREHVNNRAWGLNKSAIFYDWHALWSKTGVNSFKQD